LVAANVLECMASDGKQIELIGYLNDNTPEGGMIGDYPVLGETNDWESLSNEVFFHFSLLSVGRMKQRVSLIKGFNIPEVRLVSLIHPTAQIAKSVKIGLGTLITAHAVIQPGASLGCCCSVRSGANIGHDVQVDNFVYIGPNSTLSGYSRVGLGGFLAPNSILRDRIIMGEYSVLGAGSAALKDIPSGTTWLGVPAKRIS